MKRTLGMPQKQKLSDDDFHAYQSFIIGTMMGCDWETKDYWQDYNPFHSMLHLSYKYNDFWPILKSKFDQDGMWPVFEKRGETCVVAFFQDSVRRTDWIEFKHPRDYPDGAAAWAAAPVPPVIHEVVEGPNGDQVALEYRTAAERQAQIAAYLDAADDSDATVPRSDSDHDSDATVERSDEEEESDDGNTDAQRDRMMDAAMGQVH